MRTFKIVVLISLLLSSCVNPRNWYKIKSDDLGFEIEFPEEPKLMQQTSMTEYGRHEYNIYVLETQNKEDENLNYFAGKTVFPDSVIESYNSNIDDFFNSAIQSSIESVHGKKIHDKIINYQGYPGREVKIDFKNGEAVMTMNVYLIKNALFILETISYPEKDYNSSQTRFFNSFKLLDLN